MLGLLGLLHVYIGVRLLPALSIGVTGEVVGALLLVASWVLIPMGLTARSRQANDGGADTLVWTALIAMGLFSSLFVFTLLRDVALLIAALFTAAVASIRVQ